MVGIWITSIRLISLGVGRQACGPYGVRVRVLVDCSMLDIRCVLDGCTG